MKIGITCYPTYGGSRAVATELVLELDQYPSVRGVVPGRIGRGYPGITP